MKTIDQDIQTEQLKQAYLLYGEERYLLLQYRDKLKNAIVPDGNTMNLSVYEGKDFDQQEMMDIAETLPFFAERRLIVVERSGLFKKAADELAAYIGTAPETTYFLFVEEEADKRLKLYKAISKIGRAVEFKTQTEETLSRWIQGRLKKEGKNITQDAYHLFISRTGTDMGNIDRELEKLLCYTMNKQDIEQQDVEAVTTEQLSSRIFEMVDAIATHQQKKALDLYYDLLALKEPAMRILYLIIRQFQILMLVKVMANQGFGKKEIASKAGCPEWAVKKYQSQCRSFSMEQLKQAIRDGADYEESVKTGRMNERLAVELFLVQYSGRE